MLINRDSKSIITPSLQSGVSFATVTGICPKMVGHTYLKSSKYSKTKNIIHFQWKPIKNIKPEFRGTITEVEKCSRVSGKEEQETQGSVCSLYPKLDFIMSERCVPSWFQIIWWLSFLKFTDLKNRIFYLAALKTPQTQTEEQFCI